MLLTAGLLTLAAGAPAAAADCRVYPGDYASSSAIAIWMADGAVRRGVPGELPVMGALVESGLRNAVVVGGDSVGFFQMRVGIWNQGEYAGYPDNPDLQLKWFLDQALAVKQSRVAGGDTTYGGSESRYGEWAADILRPAAEYRGRYQPRLSEARALIGAGCPGSVAPPTTGGLPDSNPPPPDTTAPSLTVARTSAGPRGIVLAVRCDEACVARARARVSVPGAARVYRVTSAPRAVGAGATARVRLRFRPGLRRALRRARADATRVSARVRLTVADAAGNARVRRIRRLLSGS